MVCVCVRVRRREQVGAVDLESITKPFCKRNKGTSHTRGGRACVTCMHGGLSMSVCVLRGESVRVVVCVVSASYPP